MRLAKQKPQMNDSKASRFDFDLIADSYDSWYAGRRGAMYDRLEKKAIIRFLTTHVRGGKLLEVGCGTGHWSRFFSEYGFEVTGVDVSKRMIDIAKSKNISDASFQVADGRSLPFADETFDVTTAITTLEFVRDARAVVREMVRCTRKPAGQLLIGTLNVLARVNRNRKQKPESVYAQAQLFSPAQLKLLLEPFGRLTMVTAGFVPEQKLFLPLAPVIDMLGCLLRIPYGVFITAKVRL